MKWSLKIGEYKGIPVKIHATFLLIIIWVAASYWMQGHDVNTTIQGIIFVLALFACVVLHEFGHALMAQKYHIKTRDITLLPIGGVARLERMPDDPKQELWVALAGPAVNVVIAAIIYFGMMLTNAFEPISSLKMTSGSFWGRLMMVNIFLVAFNILPAFPMDGGRVLRSILAMRMDYTRATQIAANIGQGMALLFGFWGFFSNPFLIFIALFVWIGAAQESQMAQMKSAFDGIPVKYAMITNFQTLDINDKLSKAVEFILTGSQQDFPVMNQEKVIGILTRSQLMTALAKYGQNYPVTEVMEKNFQSGEASEMLQTALNRLQSCNCHIMPIFKEGKLQGILTSENIGEFLMIQTALKKEAALKIA
jgi:Zn-dependent protease/predicted transcriptional regulator